ncbi:hypothetical protein [Mastigocoleus testarum]|uniref:Uncharacterized protein n=1 Tax=Mastigocoleus testarum BC008 TaxID=371196 RepID=A0A0V7ZN32_9CYAN|nr:hypothetical protein [Mastigocoleus testarum]KST65686.1 hypothetical protein BC008_22160 [Mastigocoleus testarum BC008]
MSKEEDFERWRHNTGNESEDEQSLEGSESLNPDRPLDSDRSLDESSSLDSPNLGGSSRFSKVPLSSLGGSSLLMRAAKNTILGGRATELVQSSNQNKESQKSNKESAPLSNKLDVKDTNKDQLVVSLPRTPIDIASADTSAKLSGEEQIFVNALLGLGVSRQKALEVLEQIKSGERDRKVLMDGLLSVNPALAATLQVSGIFDKIIDGLVEYYSKNKSQQNISSPPSQAEKEEYLSKEEQEGLIKQREYYHNLKTALPTAVERTNQDLAKDKKQPFSFDGLMKKIEKGSGKQDDPNEGKKQVERINREVADKVQKLHRVDSQSPRQIDPTAIRNTILVRDYTEAQKAVGGDEPQRKILEQRFNNLKPDGAEGEISQKAVMSKANAMFKAATGKDGPENEKDRRLLESFRNSVILEWMPNAIKQDKQSGKSDDNQKSKDPVGAFKQGVKARALKQLEENRQLILDAKKEYSESNNPQISRRVERLREVERKDNQLAPKQKELEKLSKNVGILIAHGENTAQVYRKRGNTNKADKLEQAIEARKIEQAAYLQKLEEVKQARFTLLTLFPATGVLKGDDVKGDKTDGEVVERLNSGFDSVLSDIEKVEAGIHSGDIPITKLGAVVNQTLAEIPTDEEKQVVQKYLESERSKENKIALSSFAIQIGLTVAALCTGGVVGIIIAAVGASLSIGSAAYEWEIADDLNTVANTGKVGGNQLLENPQAARFNYVMGWVNLVLAGVDVLLATGEVSSLFKNAKNAERLINLPGGEVFSRLEPQEIQQLDRVRRLREAGKTDEAEQMLRQLKGKVGETDAELGLKTLSSDEAAQISGRGQKGTGDDLNADSSATPKIETPHTRSETEVKLQQLRDSLSEEGKTYFDSLRSSRDNSQEFLEWLEQKGNPQKYIEGSARGTANQTRRAAESAQRVQQARKRLDEINFFDRTDVLKIINREDSAALRSKIAAEISKQDALRQYPPKDGYQVFEEVLVSEAVPGYKSKEQWIADNPTKNPDSVYFLNGQLWRNVSDIDLIVVKSPSDKSKYKIIRIEEIKSGKNDSPNKAKRQQENIIDAIRKMSGENQQYQIHLDKRTDISSEFDTSSIHSAEAVTRGPKGKQFDEPLLLNFAELNELVKKILSEKKGK